MGPEGESRTALAQAKSGELQPIQIAAGDADGDGSALQRAGGWFKDASKKLSEGAKKVGGQIEEQVGKIDPKKIGDAAEQVISSPVGRQVIGNITSRGLTGRGGLLGAAGDVLFPQGALVERGTRELAELASRKYAKQLLENPADFALKLDGNFDILDANKSKFIENTELGTAGSALGLLDSSRGLGPILQRGFSTFANLDGKDADLGISRGDSQMLKVLTNPALRDRAISEGASSARINWGAGGLATSLVGTAGLKALAPNILKEVGGAKIGIAVVAITALSSFVGDAWKRHSLSSDFAKKEAELKSTFESIKSAL